MAFVFLKKKKNNLHSVMLGQVDHVVSTMQNSFIGARPRQHDLKPSSL